MGSESMEAELSCPLTDGRRFTGAKGEVMGADSVSDVYWTWIVWSVCRRERRNKGKIRERRKGKDVSGRRRKFSLSTSRLILLKCFFSY